MLVIPGNHDIGNAFATGFNRDKTYSVRGVTAEEKAEISHRGRALAEFAEKLVTYIKK